MGRLIAVGNIVVINSGISIITIRTVLIGYWATYKLIIMGRSLFDVGHFDLDVVLGVPVVRDFGFAFLNELFHFSL